MSDNSEGAKPKSKAKSLSNRAGLKFPVGCIRHQLHEGTYAEQIDEEAPVFLAAVLEYLATKVLELAGNVTSGYNENEIIPLHLHVAIRNDEDLNTLLFR